MKFHRLISTILSIIFLMLCTVSCGDSYKDAFIYVEFNNKPLTLDPQLVESVEEMTVVRSLFDSIYRYDTNGELVLSAAEEHTINGNTHTFTLKKDLKWVDGSNVTAKDYVFGFQRAVDPSTKAPYAYNLFCIKNAALINKGNADVSQLGVYSKDDYTLVIELEKNEEEFNKILATPICMPCNEDFFYNSKGKYGLTVDTTAANGSYYVRVWTKDEKYLIRLAKNLDYTGGFEANSMRIYFTCSEKDNISLLKQENTDLSFISTDEYSDAKSEGYNIISTEDTCYVLFVSEQIPHNVRKSLLTSIDSSKINSALFDTRRLAQNILPASFNSNEIKPVSDYIGYNEELAKSLYNQEILNGYKLSNINFLYPADKTAHEVAKGIAAHWQQTLSAFINIEQSNVYTIKQAYKNGYYDIIILPFSASSGIVTSYIADMGYIDKTINQIQNELYSNYLCFPLFYSTTNIASIDRIKNLDSAVFNGIIDVSMLIKM